MNWIIVSEDKVSINEKINEIIENIQTSDVIYHHYHDDIINQISQNSLLINPKLLIIKDAFFLNNEKKIIDNSKLIEYIIKDDTNYILTTNKIVNNFKYNQFQIIIPEIIDKKNIKKYIEKQCHKKEINISSNLLNYLINMINFDKGIINNEIAKIALLKKNNFDEENIKKIICNYSEENIFKLVEAIIIKDKNAIFKIYDDLKLRKQDEIVLITILTNQLNQLLLIKKLLLEKYTIKTIAKILSLPEFVVINNTKILQKIDIDQIKKICEDFFLLEYKIKKMKIDKVLGFKNYLISL